MGTWYLLALAVIFAGLSAVTVGLVASRLIWAWWERAIDLGPRDLLVATLTGWVGGAVVGVLVSAPAGAAMAAWLAAGTLAVASDVRCRLIPSGAMWTAAGLGLLALVTENLLQPEDGVRLGALLGLLLVAGLFAGVAFVTGGIGGGDLRLLVAAACTLWWAPALLLLGALIVAQVAGLVWLLVTRSRSAAMGPFLVAGLTVAALAGALLHL